MRSLAVMLSFLTRLPVPQLNEFREEDFANGLMWMPVVGGLIGSLMGLAYLYLRVYDDPLKAFLLLLVYLAVTGGLHLDGVSDYFDGVFSARDREGIFRIMKDPNVGTFGVIGLVLVLLGIYLGLKDAALGAVVMMPVIGRGVGVGFCAFGTYPREKGMGMPLINHGKGYHGIGAALILLTVTYFMGVQYLFAAMVTFGLMGLFFARTTKVLGGITGDVIGASIEISQAVWLISLLLIGGG